MKKLWHLLFLWPSARWRLLVAAVGILGLSMATQLEVCALGFLGDQSIDLFRLFRAGPDGLSWEQIQQQWSQLAPQGLLTRAEALQHLSLQADGNPLKAILQNVRDWMQIDVSFEMLLSTLVLLALFKASTQFLARWTIQILSIRTAADLRERCFGSLMQQPMSGLHDSMVGGLSSRVMNDVTGVAAAWPSLLHNWIQAPIVVAMSFFMCWRLSWQLSLLVFAGCPLVLGPVLWLSQRLKRTQRAVLQGQERFLGALVDWLNGLPTIRIFNLERYANKHYQTDNDRLVGLEVRSALYAQLGRPILHVVATCLIAGVGLYGLWGLGLSFGTLVVFCGMLYLLYEPVKRYAEENHTVQRACAAAERLSSLTDRVAQADEEASRKGVAQSLQNGVQFNQVSFSYRPEQPVLKSCSLVIPRGELVALVGPTGSGKSSLVQLILGLYHPDRGEILWDGSDLQTVDPASVRQQIGFVPQRPFVFQTTVRENIAFGQTLPQEEIERAARQAHAHEFIQELPHGYDTVLGEGGKSLSGGQLQRLAIARALVKPSSLLILDEATSALDAVSESLIRQTLHELRGEKTLLVIAHRLSTIADADRILVLHEGSVVAQGSLSRLLQESPLFAAMWEASQLQAADDVQATQKR
ncbi:MAG: ABC transporter ATP-binding protein [Chlamydiia bacterium]